MSEKIDPRVIRTRDLLQESLMELIKEHPFESITIRGITERARVNRSTFYAHYKDPYHLIGDCVMQRSKAIMAYEPGFLDSDPVRNYLLLARKSFEFYSLNPSLSLLLFKQFYSSPYLSDFWGNNLATARNHMRSLCSDEESYLVPPDIIAEYVSAGGAKLITYWLENNMTSTVDEFTVYFTRTFFMSACAMMGIEPPAELKKL